MSDPIMRFEIAGSDDSKLKDFYENLVGQIADPAGNVITLIENIKPE